MAKKKTSRRKTKKTVSARKKTVKKSTPARKKTVKKAPAPKPVVEMDVLDFDSAALMDAVQELEEITSKAKDVAVQLIRTEELQDDLNANCEKQVGEKEVLDEQTAELVEERDKLHAELTALFGEIADLDKDLKAYTKTIEKSEDLKAKLSEKKKDLESEHASLTAENKNLVATEKKLNVEIAKLKQSRKELTS